MDADGDGMSLLPRGLSLNQFKYPKPRCVSVRTGNIDCHFNCNGIYKIFRKSHSGTSIISVKRTPFNHEMRVILRVLDTRFVGDIDLTLNVVDYSGGGCRIYSGCTNNEF